MSNVAVPSSDRRVGLLDPAVSGDASGGKKILGDDQGEVGALCRFLKPRGNVHSIAKHCKLKPRGISNSTAKHPAPM